MTDTEGRQRARQIVQEVMDERGESVASIARLADLDAGTVGDFLSGKRWPQRAKRSAIEKALELTPGSITAWETNDELFFQRAESRKEGATAGGRTLADATELELVMALLDRIHRRLGADGDPG